MKKIIAIIVLTLTLSILSSAQTAGNTKTICKGEAIPEGYTTVGEAQSGDCPNGAWVIKQRATSRPRLEQSDAGSPRMTEENSTGNGRSTRSASTIDPVEFARKTFELLTRGDIAVEQMIDWDHLQIEGKDFGSILIQIATSTKKDMSTFRKEFIVGFPSYYAGSGDGPLNNWQIDSRNGESTIVAASNAKGEVTLFTVSIRGGRQLVTALSSRK